jgi:hypothetical protein
VLGISLQLLGGVFVLLGLIIPHRSRSFYRLHCRDIDPTVWEMITRECWPGQHREMLIGYGMAAAGLFMLILGRWLAKRSGLD